MTTTSWGRSLADAEAAAVPLRRPGDDASPQHAARTLAYDTATGRTGEIVGRSFARSVPQRVYLRPVGGGIEWSARPEDVQPVAEAGDSA